MCPCAPGRENTISACADDAARCGSVLMASDSPPEYVQKVQGFAVSLTATDVADAERKFNALADGVHRQHALQQDLLDPSFGMCTDKFGIPWMVNCPAEGMSEAPPPRDAALSGRYALGFEGLWVLVLGFAPPIERRRRSRPFNSSSRDVRPPRRLIQDSRTGPG